jgi:hypothetical protein
MTHEEEELCPVCFEPLDVCACDEEESDDDLDDEELD